jgi:hypothetical protein
MEMVKYAVMLVAIAAMFVSIDSAQARGRRGGCPGGVCYTGGAKTLVVAAEPAKVVDAAAGPAVAVDAPAEAATVAAQPAGRNTLVSRYSARPRRLFGRRY